MHNLGLRVGGVDLLQGIRHLELKLSPPLLEPGLQFRNRTDSRLYVHTTEYPTAVPPRWDHCYLQE